MLNRQSVTKFIISLVISPCKFCCYMYVNKYLFYFTIFIYQFVLHYFLLFLPPVIYNLYIFFIKFQIYFLLSFIVYSVFIVGMLLKYI